MDDVGDGQRDALDDLAWHPVPERQTHESVGRAIRLSELAVRTAVALPSHR